jgi:hypothetical protein
MRPPAAISVDIELKAHARLRPVVVRLGCVVVGRRRRIIRLRSIVARVSQI